MICDHDTLRGVDAMKSLLSSEDNLLLIPGIEILTDLGEVIGVWLDEMPPTNRFMDLIDYIRTHDGLVLIPHPFDKIRGKSFQLHSNHVEAIDAIEVLNSRCIIPFANKRAEQFADKFNLIQTAGSDAHFSLELGRAWLSFEGSTSEDFRKALKNHETTIGGKKSPFKTHLYTIKHRMNRSIFKWKGD
ncbi:MAG: PHP domain-containing protein [Candidatus Heimdallarchaeota archaeon]|nr:PHP domain-containing protein [Candidatus Heimdallarchaeota archaeon]